MGTSRERPSQTCPTPSSSAVTTGLERKNQWKKGILDSSRLPRHPTATTQKQPPVYSLVDFDLEDQDPEVEKFLRHIFPRDAQDFDPEVCDTPVCAIRRDSDDPQDLRMDMSTTSVPPLEHVIPEFRSNTSIPAPIRSLYGLPCTLRDRDVSAVGPRPAR